MGEPERQMKVRWESYSVDLRRTDRARAFHTRRRQAPQEEAVTAEQVRVLESFRQLKQQMGLAHTPEAVLAVLLAIKNHLTTSNSPSALPAAQFEAAGLFDVVLFYAQIDSLAGDGVLADIVSLSLWVLSNYFAAGSYTREFVEQKGVVALMQRLISFDRPQITENALFCLANIVGDYLDLREELLSREVYQLLFEALDRYPDRVKLHEVGAWLISNSLRPPAFAFEEQLVRRAAALLCDSRSVETAREALWGVAFYLDRQSCNTQRIEFVAGLGIFPALQRQLLALGEPCARPLLRIYGYLSYGPLGIVSQFYSEQFVDALLQYIALRGRDLQHDALWILSNMIATSPELQAGLFTEKNLQKVLEVCAREECPAGNRAEALRALSNYACFASAEQIEFLQAKFDLANVLLLLLEPNATRPAAFYTQCLCCVAYLCEMSRKTGAGSFLAALAASPHLANLQALLSARERGVAAAAQKLLLEVFPQPG